MILKVNLNIRCRFCGNNREDGFYIMPVEEKILDGSYLSITKYEVACKRCNQKEIFKINIEKGER